MPVNVLCVSLTNQLAVQSAKNCQSVAKDTALAPPNRDARHEMLLLSLLLLQFLLLLLLPLLLLQQFSCCCCCKVSAL